MFWHDNTPSNTKLDLYNTHYRVSSFHLPPHILVNLMITVFSFFPPNTHYLAMLNSLSLFNPVLTEELNDIPLEIKMPFISLP